jgi:cysteine synthase B
MPWDPRIQALVDRHPSLRAVGNTPLVPVDVLRRELPDVEVFAKMESLNPGGSLKDRPVLRMLLSALDDGRLKPGKTVLDSSSGNAGIAYAMIGRMIGVPVEIVIPDNASAERKKRMRAHGARLTFTDALLGYDEALREVRRRYEADPGHYFFCDQYSNQDNWRAHYETTAVEILEQTRGRVGTFVVGGGTGGTISGVGRRLKATLPGVRMVLADWVGSGLADWVETGRIGPDGTSAVEGVSGPDLAAQTVGFQSRSGLLLNGPFPPSASCRLCNSS